MTQPLPLTGTALEIARRLDAHQTVDHVTEVGRWKRSWQREDVLAVERWLWLQASERKDRRAEPVVREDCGTAGGWHHHQNNGERVCEACQEAKRKYQRDWRRRTGGAA